jgi:hypothetical protein
MTFKNTIRGEIVRLYGTQRAFCEAKRLSYTRFSRVLNGQILPSAREQVEIGKLLKRARIVNDEAASST